jgi:hypothetical protein
LALPEDKRADSWLEKRREKKRLKRERTGDSPQKAREGKRSKDPDVTGAMAHTGTTGFLGGGGV